MSRLGLELHVQTVVSLLEDGLSLHCPRFGPDRCGPRSGPNRTHRSWVRSYVRADWSHRTHIYRSEVRASVDRTWESNPVRTWSGPLKKCGEVTEVTLADASLCDICHITQRRLTPWTGWQQQLQLQLPTPTTTMTTTAAPAAATTTNNDEDDNNSCSCSCHRQRGRQQQQLHLQLPAPTRTTTITAAAAAATVDEDKDEDNNNGRRGCPPPRHWFERANEEGLSPSPSTSFQHNGRRGCPPPRYWFERANEEGLSPSPSTSFQHNGGRGFPPPPPLTFQHNGRRGCPPPHHWFECANEEGLSPSPSTSFHSTQRREGLSPSLLFTV